MGELFTLPSNSDFLRDHQAWEAKNFIDANDNNG